MELMTLSYIARTFKNKLKHVAGHSFFTLADILDGLACQFCVVADTFMLQLTVEVLKANYEKEVDQLKTMMPDDEQPGSQDAAVVDTGLILGLG